VVRPAGVEPAHAGFRDRLLDRRASGDQWWWRPTELQRRSTPYRAVGAGAVIGLIRQRSVGPIPGAVISPSSIQRSASLRRTRDGMRAIAWLCLGAASFKREPYDVSRITAPRGSYWPTRCVRSRCDPDPCEIGGVTVDRPVRVAARANAMAIRGRQGPEAVAIAPPWMASACAVAIMAPKRGQGHYLHHQLAHWNTSNLNADEQGGKGQRGDS
jgi:hypothetical protein